MGIKFKSITYQNFMAVGNAPVTVQLDAHLTTLITAINGSGKSTLLDAISFALYGKAYRNINKTQLVNSINQKKMLVVLDFEIGKQKYVIRRGSKPQVFEIWENGKLFNQDPDVRDYQKILETQIVKMNYRAFTQVVVMGSSSYIPFMKLKPHERREFIEDLLDIKIFSVMNKLLFQKMKDGKEAIRDIELEIKSTKEKIELQESFIKSRKKERGESADRILGAIEQAQSDIGVAQGEINKVTVEIEGVRTKLTEYEDVPEKLSELNMERKKLSIAMKEKKEEHDFYSETEHCPTCRQSIGDDHKSTIMDNIHTELGEYESALNEIAASIVEITEILGVMDDLNREISDFYDKISGFNQTIHGNNLLIKKYNKELDELQNNTESLDEDKEKLRNLAKNVLDLSKKKKKMLEDQQYQNVAYNMLLDNGIKAKIIKQYIPVINKLVNKYLNGLDFFCNFNLDENFNEIVKSRYRDEFSYDSFSEGEKQRIDLAILMSWRDVARMKNSVSTNLVVFDELFDASLDQTGVDLAMSLINGMGESNVFVISHKEGIADKFSNTIRFTKKNNFTVVDTV